MREATKGQKIFGYVATLAIIGGVVAWVLSIPNAHDTPVTRSSPTVVQVANWRDSGGSEVLASVSTDLGDVSTSAQNQDLTGTRTALVRLRTDVLKAENYTPIPDARTQTAWSQALSSLFAAASDGIVSLDTPDVSLVNRYLDDMAAANASLASATDRIAGLS